MAVIFYILFSLSLSVSLSFSMYTSNLPFKYRSLESVVLLLHFVISWIYRIESIFQPLNFHVQR